MKATFRSDGTLVLTPESGTEAFALASWYAKSDDGLKVLLSPSNGDVPAAGNSE